MDKKTRIIINKGNKILPPQQYFVRDITKDFHTKYGIISKNDLKKKNTKIKSSTGKEYSIFEPSFIDFYKKISRGPQIIPLKDIGIIIAKTGIGKNSVIIEAGGGSGGFGCFVANYVKKVISYEIEDKHIEIMKQNIKSLGLKNIIIKKADIYENIEEKNIDMIVLDLPEPWRAIKNAEKALKTGGFLVSYSPTIMQTHRFVNSLTDLFFYIETIELMERPWKIEGIVARPLSKSIIHSGFITFARKI